MSDQTPLYNYFLVCPPELVSLAQSELKHKAHDLVQQISPQRGGVSFQAEAGSVQLNAWLKIPTRLLLELARFKVRDLPKLYKKIQARPWHRELYSFEGVPIWKISAKRSRLIHTAKIEKTLNEAFSDAQKSRPFRKPPQNVQNFPPTFYVHLEDDELILSLDTSGEPLYKRGFKKASVVGPLRESLASACLTWAFEQLNLDSTTSFQLLDPMAGSGSFALEALTLEVTSFEARTFSYQHLPQFQNLKKLEFKNFNSPKLQNAVVCDLKAKGLKENLKRFSQVQVLEGDAFQLNFPEKEAGLYRLAICNPPYGERVPKNFELSKLIKLLKNSLAADAIALLGPRSWDLNALAKAEDLELLQPLDLKNGGLPTRFWVLKV